jgi:hypothetical protein
MQRQYGVLWDRPGRAPSRLEHFDVRIYGLAWIRFRRAHCWKIWSELSRTDKREGLEWCSLKKTSTRVTHRPWRRVREWATETDHHSSVNGCAIPEYPASRCQNTKSGALSACPSEILVIFRNIYWRKDCIPKQYSKTSNLASSH